MREIKGIYRGAMAITGEEVLLRGIMDGDLVIDGEAHVELRGILQGNLTLKAGKLRLTGIVRGNVTNEGGELLVTGIVGGALRPAGGTTVRENALVEQ